MSFLFRAALLCVVLIAYAPVSHAQILTGLERNLELRVSPEYPSAGEQIQLSLSGLAVDLNRSMITWYVNGKQSAKETGLTTLETTVGALGSTTIIQVVAEEGGIVGSARATIRPTEVDLLWNADSYTPPFYRGRTLSGVGATIHAQALVRFKKPNGTFVGEKDIIFSWYKGSQKIAGGKGKSSIAFPGPSLFGEDVITVLAESADKLFVGKAVTRIQNTDPSVGLYENHPLFGTLYHRAFSGSATTLERDQTVTAVPFFANIQSANDPSLVYEWSINNSPVPAVPEHPSVFTISTEGYTGPVSIKVLITSTVDWFLRASGTWDLIFEKSSSGLLPGNPFGN